MTVTLAAKLHEIQGTTEESDSRFDDTCCTTNKPCGIHDHTGSLLQDLTDDICQEFEEELGNVETYDELYYEKARILRHYDDAPEYLKHNPYIRTGYRSILNTELCIESVMWWTNETINIWSHVFGLVLFISLTIYDLIILKIEASIADKLLVGSILICFQICMASSALYHTFNCRSEKDCDLFLCFDLFGIALSLFGIYVSGIYYAFWCDTALQNFYLSTVTIIFVVAMILQIPTLNIHENIKLLVFVGWALYGGLPTLHWYFKMGGFENPVVELLLPRVLGMYAISGTAFLIYITRIPERFAAGKFDFIGHSHQWWHLFVVAALYYWHNTGMLYVDYRLNHACANSMRLP